MCNKRNTLGVKQRDNDSYQCVVNYISDSWTRKVKILGTRTVTNCCRNKRAKAVVRRSLGGLKPMFQPVYQSKRTDERTILVFFILLPLFPSSLAKSHYIQPRYWFSSQFLRRVKIFLPPRERHSFRITVILENLLPCVCLFVCLFVCVFPLKNTWQLFLFEELCEWRKQISRAKIPILQLSVLVSVDLFHKQRILNNVSWFALKRFNDLASGDQSERRATIRQRSMAEPSLTVTLVMNALTIQIKGRQLATTHQLEYAWTLRTDRPGTTHGERRLKSNGNVSLPHEAWKKVRKLIMYASLLVNIPLPLSLCLYKRRLRRLRLSTLPIYLFARFTPYIWHTRVFISFDQLTGFD